MQVKDAIPVTILTGFLGAGKTTLLNHLVSQKHGYKCAIIVNEFGAISIDNQLVVGVDEEILELNNGCLCCRVRGDLIKSLSGLLRKQKRFDYVLIETTGLADPSPIAYTFRSSELAERLRLDAIVTVVDAKHLEKELSDSAEAAAQVGFADVILLNKVDLVSPTELEHIAGRLYKMNPLARIHRTRNAQVEVSNILNIKARELLTPLAMPSEAHDEEHEHEHGHDHDHKDDAHQEHAHGSDTGLADETPPPPEHYHDEAVRSFYLIEERPLEIKKVEAWLTEVIKTTGANMYRSKGILQIKGHAKRVVFQGVQMMFDAVPDRLWGVNEKRLSQVVFIGKDLDEAAIRRGFESCVAT